MRRWLSLARGHRGNVLVMVTLTMGGLLAFTGVAVDVGRVITTKTQLQNAFDAGSLAGASNLGFDDSALPVAGTAAVNWSSKNPYTGGAPTLTAWSTVTNASATANVQMGIWSNGSWVPSVDGTRVNAVHCQWGTNVPTPFLSLIGLSSIKISATATALSGPAANPDTPIMPLAVCPGANGTSAGCGTLQIIDVAKVPTQTSWIHWSDLTKNGVPGLGEAVDLTNACSNGGSCTPTNLNAGDKIVYVSGSKTPVVKTISADFTAQSSKSTRYTVKDSTDHVQYNDGPGWQSTVAIICPEGSGEVSGINTFARFVMVQMVRATGIHMSCPSSVSNPNPAITDPVLRQKVTDLCNDTSSLPPSDYVIGFIDCQPINSIITDIPGPRVSLGTKVRLVR